MGARGTPVDATEVEPRWWWAPILVAAPLLLASPFLPAAVRRPLLVVGGLLFAGGLMAYGLTCLARRRWSRDPSTVSLVALLDHPAPLEATIVAVRASEAWQIEVGTEEDENEAAYVVGESPHFLLKRDDWLFAIHDGDDPYFPAPRRVVTASTDVRVRRVVEEHRGWISVDLLYGPGGTDPAEAYALIGPLLAELVGEDLLGVHRPETGLIHPRVPQLDDALRSDDPIAALDGLKGPPVLTIREDDPRMLAAVATARAQWWEFVNAFETRSSHTGYSVKAPVTDGESTEFLWLNVTAIENGVVYGRLGNEPVALRNLRLNDPTSVTVEQLNDWLYVHEGRTRGGFTLDVFRQVAEEPGEEGKT